MITRSHTRTDLYLDLLYDANRIQIDSEGLARKIELYEDEGSRAKALRRPRKTTKQNNKK